MDSHNGSKIQVIKAVRELTGLGLGDAKALVESAPVIIMDNMTKADAEACVRNLENAGGSATVVG